MRDNRRLTNFGMLFLGLVGLLVTGCSRKSTPPPILGDTSAKIPTTTSPTPNTLHRDSLKNMQPIAKRPERILTYEREACYGKCPVYTLQIYDDGTILLDGKRYVKRLGKSQFKASKAQMTQLAERTRQAALWQMADTYPARGVRIAELPASHLILQNEKQEKKITNYHDAPTALVEFEAYLDEWVNDLLN